MIEFKLEYGTMCRSCGEDIAQGEACYAESFDELDDGNTYCNNCMNDPSISIRKVMKIDSEGRYIFLVPSEMPDDVFQELTESLREWWESGINFLWCRGDLTLVRLSEDGKAETIHEAEA